MVACSNFVFLDGFQRVASIQLEFQASSVYLFVRSSSKSEGVTQSVMELVPLFWDPCWDTRRSWNTLRKLKSWRWTLLVFATTYHDSAFWPLAFSGHRLRNYLTTLPFLRRGAQRCRKEVSPPFTTLSAWSYYIDKGGLSISAHSPSRGVFVS